MGDGKKKAVRILIKLVSTARTGAHPPGRSVPSAVQKHKDSRVVLGAAGIGLHP